jgi:flagellar biosynthetic protein FliQ
MNEQTVLALARETLTVSMVISAPLLLVAVVVGLGVTVLQTITSVQEQTLTFVVKLGAMLAVMVILMPWLIQTLCTYTAGLLTNLDRFAR